MAIEANNDVNNNSRNNRKRNKEKSRYKGGNVIDIQQNFIKGPRVYNSMQVVFENKDKRSNNRGPGVMGSFLYIRKISGYLEREYIERFEKWREGI